MNYIIFLTLIYIVKSQQDYCVSVEESGSTSCKDCVEITILGGRPNCAYCANPYSGMSYCQKPFYPPSLNTPGMTIFACYNDSGIATDIFRYKPRCAASDCYIDQCLVSGKILWYYIVPSVIGFIILLFIIWLIGCKRCKWCNKNNEYIDRENERDRKSKQNLQQKANDRKRKREIELQSIKKKYTKDDFCVEEIV
jgi:hypothetical protein